MLVVEEHQLLLSNSVFDEFSEVLHRPRFNRYIPDKEARLDFFLKIVQQASLNIEPNISLEVVRDPKDNKYLELAVAGRAHCLVSSDRDLLCLHPYEGINIFTASGFLAHYSM